MDVVVRDNPTEGRFEAIAGGEVAGFAEYRLDGGQIAFTHTEVDSSVEHLGVGTRLIQTSLDAARGRGLTVLPYCPFVRQFIADHASYLDLVPSDRRASWAL